MKHKQFLYLRDITNSAYNTAKQCDFIRLLSLQFVTERPERASRTGEGFR